MRVVKLCAFTLILLALSLPVSAQAPDFVRVQDTISSNGDSFVVAVRGFASARFQTLDSFSGTWEVQCSVDDGTTYDTDDEVNLFLEGASSSAVQAVTDTVGIWTASVAGCTHIKIIATAGFAASDTVVAVSAVASGGSSGSGGGSSAGGALADDADFTAGTTDVVPAAGFYQSSVTACTDGDTCAVGITSGRAVKAHLTDANGASLTIANDATHDSAASSTGPQIMGGAKNTTLPTAVTDGDAVRLMTDLFGRLTPKNMCSDPDLVTSVVISTATSGNVELVAISGSTVVTVCGFNVMAGGTVGVQFISGTGTACATGETNKTGVYPLIVNGGISTGFGSKVFAGAAGEAVCVELSAAVQIDGILSYVQR